MKLTEDMVVARSRGAELNSIRKLNCWGSEICDVSVVRQLPNIEVLALSVNNITTLADFQHCPNLSELYIRQNNIKDLNEVMYLKELPKLKALWLADNPCATREGYRLALLRTLPHLQKLDNTPVESEEVQKAMLHGEDLVHPAEAMEMQRQQQQQQQQQQHQQRRGAPDSRRSSHASSTGYGCQQQPQSYQEETVKYQQEPRPEPTRYQESRSEPVRYQESRPEPAPAERSRSPEYYPSQAPSQQQSYQQSAYRPTSPQVYESAPTAGHAMQCYDDRYKAAACPVHRSPTEVQQRSSFSSYRDSAGCRDGGYRDSVRRSAASPERQYAASASDGDGYRGSEAAAAVHGYSSEHSSLRQYDVRPKKKSPNVLSAVLCLVKELDLHGLEVVDTAVRCRIQELED